MTNKQLDNFFFGTGQGLNLNFNICQGENAHQDARTAQCLLRLNEEISEDL